MQQELQGHWELSLCLSDPREYPVGPGRWSPEQGGVAGPGVDVRRFCVAWGEVGRGLRTGLWLCWEGTGRV